MEEIDRKLKEYIEQSIFPIYEKNDVGHRIEHIYYVINRSLKLMNQFDNINPNMVYTIASFHDVAHHIDRLQHEKLSANLFYEDEKMKEFFTNEERKIIKEAIIDHRASLEYEPRSNYGKIISSADKNVDVQTALKRTHAYTIKNYPKISLEEILNRGYNHLTEKFGEDGYAKNYCTDEEYEKYIKELQDLLKSKDKFTEKYIEVNNISIK